MERLKLYMPYLIAGVITLNGFFTLLTGLEQTFQFSFYLKLDSVSDYLEMAPRPQLGGFVNVALGVTLIGLGVGLAERRQRAWWWALGMLILVSLNGLIQWQFTSNMISAGFLLVLLLVFRPAFTRPSRTREWSVAELIAIISVIFALAYGILGSYLMRAEFATIEGWVDAVYFTIVTYSTLGYGDILPQTANAKLFTISMVFIGLSSFVTALTVLLGPFIEDHVKGVFSAMSKFQKTVNHVVICGFSNVTDSIADELKEKKIPFLIIDEREEVVAHFKSLGWDVYSGDPTQLSVLEQANLPNAAAVIAATDSDATNTLIALTARDLREKGGHDFRIIVRCEDEENIAKVAHIGDEIVSPSTMGGRMMGQKAIGSLS